MDPLPAPPPPPTPPIPSRLKIFPPAPRAPLFCVFRGRFLTKETTSAPSAPQIVGFQLARRRVNPPPPSDPPPPPLREGGGGAQSTTSASPAYREGSSGGHLASWTRRGPLSTQTTPCVRQTCNTVQGSRPKPKPKPLPRSNAFLTQPPPPPPPDNSWAAIVQSLQGG